MNNHIVDDIRRIRHEHAARFGNDIRAIFADLRARERESQRQFQSFPPTPARHHELAAASSTMSKDEAVD